MLFKVLAIAIIFVAARSFFRSWKFFNELQQKEEQKKRKNPRSNDDAIDAEYRVVED